MNSISDKSILEQPNLLVSKKLHILNIFISYISEQLKHTEDVQPLKKLNKSDVQVFEVLFYIVFGMHISIEAVI